MSTTTTHGYKKPSTGDRGTWWTNLEFNIDRVDGHSHDGTDSVQISTADLDKQTTDILAASWVATAGQAGTYEQTVTLPTGITFPKVAVKFIVNGGGEDGAELFLSTIKVTASTYKVYINDNTIALKAVYA